MFNSVNNANAQKETSFLLFCKKEVSFCALALDLHVDTFLTIPSAMSMFRVICNFV